MSLLSSALTMLQAKLFIICNQALIQTGTQVDGSNPLKAKTPARQFSCCDLQRTMTALRLHLSHRIRLVRILKADMAWGSITSSVRLPFRSIPQATSRRRNGP